MKRNVKRNVKRMVIIEIKRTCEKECEEKTKRDVLSAAFVLSTALRAVSARTLRATSRQISTTAKAAASVPGNVGRKR